MRRLVDERLRGLDLVKVEVLGPVPCFYRKVRGRYRWQLLVLGERLEGVLEVTPLGHGWITDVEPVSVL